MGLDYNDASDRNEPRSSQELSAEKDRLRAALLGRIEDVLFHLFPAGHVHGNKFYIGNVRGDPGDSMDVDLDGPKAGLWSDFASDDGGDIFSLWATVRGLEAKRDFPKLLADIVAWLGGKSSPVPSPRPKAAKQTSAIDTLGPYTSKWDYHDADGKLIACVYRYDTDKGKEFRPWDIKSRTYKAPEPRPLYNIPDILKSDTVILVEGEKCADALIGQNLCATTAMNGAKAPVDKTDWSPLKGKQVFVWPDNDEPGLAYAENAAQAVFDAGARSVAIIPVPQDKPKGWDAADAFEEGFDCLDFIRNAINAHLNIARNYSVRELLADVSPMPPDIIAPRILTQGGLLVFGGAPKVGKSDFILCWLTHMAAGVEFLGMRPPRRLRIFILQAEIQYHYLRERIRKLRIDPDIIDAALDNLVITPQLKLVLNEAGLATIVNTIKQRFGEMPPDIIVIDPLRNVFDGGDGEASENDNNAMLFFLQKRVEALRDSVNPDAGIIIVHHTSKMPKKLIEEDPFRALSGANALRGYYTSGMLLFRPDEMRGERHLYYELRNGEAIPYKVIDKAGGQWIEIDRSQQPLVRQDYSRKLEAELRRKRDVILQILFEEALQGHVYTSSQFAQAFENKSGLGAERTVRERLSVLATKGYIKYFQNADDYGLRKPARTKFGYMCVEEMDLQTLDDLKRILPTHYKSRADGVPLRVENPEIWNYYDDGEDA